MPRVEFNSRKVIHYRGREEGRQGLSPNAHGNGDKRQSQYRSPEPPTQEVHEERKCYDRQPAAHEEDRAKERRFEMIIAARDSEESVGDVHG